MPVLAPAWVPAKANKSLIESTAQTSKKAKAHRQRQAVSNLVAIHRQGFRGEESYSRGCLCTKAAPKCSALLPPGCAHLGIVAAEVNGIRARSVIFRSWRAHFALLLPALRAGGRVIIGAGLARPGSGAFIRPLGLRSCGQVLEGVGTLARASVVLDMHCRSCCFDLNRGGWWLWCLEEAGKMQVNGNKENNRKQR